MAEDKKREKVIQELQKKGIIFNPASETNTLEKLLKEDTTVTTGETKPKEKVTTGTTDVLNQIMKTLTGINDRLVKLEGGDTNGYKLEAKSEDIEKASKNKKDIDPKIVGIVEELLGVDFGIDVKTFDDKPGLEFTIIVPSRLSDNVQDSRPKKGIDGTYEKDAYGNVVFENYIPEDRRSRVIGSLQSYDAIREHCTRIRSYIVGYYTKLKKPLPEFKVK